MPRLPWPLLLALAAFLVVSGVVWWFAGKPPEEPAGFASSEPVQPAPAPAQPHPTPEEEQSLITPTPAATPAPPPSPSSAEPSPSPEPPPPPPIRLYRVPQPGRTAVFAVPPMPVLLDLWEPPLSDLVALPVANRFDFPAGTPHGAFVYNAQAFGKRSHVGDDWNGLGGYDSDLGDPVYAAATGRVVMAAWLGGDWGNVVVIQHAIEEQGERRYVQTLYAHLHTILTRAGQLVRRGQKIATIGNADGRFYAHLHFEVRTFGSLYIGGGYRVRPQGWLSPTPFLRERRGAAADDFSPEIPPSARN